MASIALVSVEDFLRVRQHIANLLKEDSSTQPATRIRQAENLMKAGVIDVAQVAADLHPTDQVAEDTEEA
jgi:hypothetical protein